MPFSKQAINFLYQNSASIGKLFNLQEHKEFLLQFVTENKIQKFLSAGKTNFDHVEKLITFIQFEDHNRLYEALTEQVKKIHLENGQFVNAMLQACERNVDNKKDDTMIVTHKYKMEKELMNSMKEILSDMKIICEENQKLKIAENDERESRESYKIVNEILSKEVMKLNAETKRLKSELSQSFDNIENLEVKVAELLSLRDKQIEQTTNVEVKSNQIQLNFGDSEEAAAALFNKGEVHYDQNEFNAALDYHTQALEMCQRLHNGDHVNIAEYLFSIAIDYNKLQQWNKSLEYHNKCLQMRRRLYSGDHEDIAGSLDWIGAVHYNQNEFNAALDYHTQALEMYQRLHNGDHVNIALYLHNIAMDYYKLQQWNKSLAYHNKCLQMRRRLHSENIADTLSCIGLVHSNQNNYKEALDICNEALQMSKRLHKEDHVETANVLNNIGVVHYNQNKLKKALDYHLQSLQMWQRLYNGDHFDIALSLNKIGFVYEKKRDLIKSLDYFTRCLEMRHRLYPGGDHVDVKEAAANVDRIKQLMK